MIVKFWNMEDDPNVFFITPFDLDETRWKDQDTIDVPRNKAIFLSPINYIHVQCCGEPSTSDRQMKKEVKHEIDIIDPNLIRIELDGKEIGDQCERVGTDFFETMNGRAISDGYWLLLEPKALKKGVHELKTFGTCRSGQIQLSTTTKLNVI